MFFILLERPNRSGDLTRLASLRRTDATNATMQGYGAGASGMEDPAVAAAAAANYGAFPLQATHTLCVICSSCWRAEPGGVADTSKTEVCCNHLSGGQVPTVQLHVWAEGRAAGGRPVGRSAHAAH